ncbi:MAG: cell division protein FtsZ [Betaproteobacteria bacterium]|nr:cell division protein FtsZ [Betaproteobacteria bacterium]MCC6249023.1 cell division protein FtsZ [Rubrivivax sp.]MCL4699905.1 cell division protein FtsZ [Burkholderiaceae bacterium]
MNLTTALAVLGGVVLLALALHGWWRIRRLAPQRAALVAQGPHESDEQTTVPLESERVEPTLGPEDAPAAEGAVKLEDGLQPVTPAELAAALRSPPRRELRLDALIDAIVPLVLEHPITGEAALAHLPPTRRAGSKPFYVEGLDAETGEWEPIAIGRRYGELQAGVQLASRSGALNEIEYSEFVQKIEAFAEAVHARADAPDMLDVVARARELDGLASPLDAQLSIGLKSRGVAWSVSYLQQIAARAGFVPGVLPGRWVLPAGGEGEPPLLVLSVDAQAALAEDPQAAAVRECMLSLDVPQTPRSLPGGEPFAALHRMTAQLCDDLDAVAVDDHGEPITPEAFEAIGAELARLYEALEALDLAAGTPAARRLFS